MTTAVTIDDLRVPEDAPDPDGPMMRVLDRTGDSRFSWDPSNSGEVDKAREHYDALKAKGYLAYKVRNNRKSSETISDFDPAEREIIMAPQIVGG